MTQNKGKSIMGAAGILVIAMIISRVLGYLREVVIYAQFGQNRLTDAYNAAFSIPDFLYLLLVGGALSSAFIPVFSSYIARDEKDEAWEVAWTVFHVAMGLMLIGIIIGIIFTPNLINLLVPGFDAQTKVLTVLLTRVMFVQALFMAASGISMAILNSNQHFLWPAVGSVLYNLGIILVGYFLSKSMGIMGFSIGVVVGSVMYFLVQLPMLRKLGMRYRFSLNLRHPGFKRILRLILPVLIGMSANQINLFVNQMLASTLSGGLVAALRSGQRLMMLPIGVFAVAVAVATFPTLSEQAALGREQEFKKTASLGLRTIFFVALPSTTVLIALRLPLIRFLFQQGEFTAQATQATAVALLFYALGIVGYSGIQLLNRIFYAMKDTRTPVTTSITAMLLNIFLNFALIGVMGHGGLALAYSLAGTINMAMLMYLMWRKIGGMNLSALLKSFINSSVAAAAAGLTAYGISFYFETAGELTGKLNQGLELLAAGGAAVLIYLLLAVFFKMEEAQLVLQLAGRRFHKKGVKKS